MVASLLRKDLFNASNVMLVVKGQATRVGFKVEDGKKVRIAKKTGEVID